MESILEEDAASPVRAVEGSPALWNPTAAMLWSLLLTPIVGSWIVMRNWTLLGSPGKARLARHWLCGFLFLQGVQLGWTVGILFYEVDTMPPWWGSLVLWAAWAALAAYPQMKHIDEHYGETYARRSLVAPLLITFAILCVLWLSPSVVLGYQSAAADAAAGA